MDNPLSGICYAYPLKERVKQIFFLLCWELTNDFS